MEQLNGDQARKLLLGNTMTMKADFGRWVEYISEDGASGVPNASGDWGSESVTVENAIFDDGEWCSVYVGDHEWSKPEFTYCSMIYQDAESNYVIQTTRNDRRQERVGQINKISVASGDKYGLLN